MSAAGTALAFAEAFAAPADALLPSLCLLGGRNPADPFVTGERGDVLPCGQSFCVSLQLVEDNPFTAAALDHNRAALFRFTYCAEYETPPNAKRFQLVIGRQQGAVVSAAMPKVFNLEEINQPPTVN